MVSSGAPKDVEPSPQGRQRQRAPTITIDTTEAGTMPAPEPAQDPFAPVTPASTHLQDDTVSPTTSIEPVTRTWTSPEKTPAALAGRPQLRAGTAFDGKDSRPQSPHNVSSPVKPRGLLAVPSNLRSRNNSVDAESFVSSQSDNITIGAGDVEKHATMVSNDAIMNDEYALKPDQGKEADFHVDDNPFAFSPGQLGKLLNPKNLAAFYRLGGLTGLELGLQTDRKAGLSVDEDHPSHMISFERATGHVANNSHLEDLKHDSPLHPRPYSAGLEGKDDQLFSDRKRVFKDNRLPEKKGKSLLRLMWITYQDKVLMLLTAAAVVSLAIGIYQSVAAHHRDEKEGKAEPRVEWVEGVAIVVAILIVVIVGSLNDYSKERQFAKLNRKKQDRVVRAVRSGKTIELSVFDILVGDVIHLEPGDLVPVDGILIEGFNVKCDESQATGESDIIKKKAADDVFAAIENHEDVKKLDPFILSGSRVMEGVGTFMVTSTGVYSTHGQTLMALSDDPEVTPLQSKLNIIAEYIAKLGGAAGLLLFVVLFIIFLVNLPKMPPDVSPAEKGQKFLDIFIMVVTIIVVAVPEGLPLAVTLALAFATTRMIKDNNLVRHLKACEVMGNATNICSDKTGTLTQNKMQVVAGTIGTTHRFGAQRGENTSDDTVINGESNSVPIGEFSSGLSSSAKEILVKSIALNSTAFEGDVDGQKTFIGSKTETALLLLARDHLAMGSVSAERESVQTLQLFPFDSGRKCMAIVVQLPQGGARFFVKGASEIVLEKCTHVWKNPSDDASIQPMSTEDHRTIDGLINSYASRSLRTIGLAYKDFERWPPRPHSRRHDGDKNEVQFEDIFRHMTFVSMVGIQDPLRDGVPEAVRICQKAGVCVRMVTGDNKITAQAIAKECGILQPDSIIMEGPEFRNLSKRHQQEIIPRLHVLARSSPDDKRILVKRLKDKGEIVAVTGDGTNDAPALKMADVGFSMGIAGTEVAKEASAIILMDDNFNSIVKALMWGRAVNDAVKRFLQFQLTVNITAVILTFVTAVSSERSVLTAVQLLWVNLIMDTLAALALATDPPQRSILDRLPERRNASIITPTMWKMILGQAVYQLAITFLLYYGSTSVLPGGNLLRLAPHDLKIHIRTLVFNTFVWMQIFNQWNNRRLDNRFNILEGITRNYFFMAISCIMIGGQTLIIFFGGPAFQISPIRQAPRDWAVAIVLGFLSIPIGMLIRLIPDAYMSRLVPDFIKRRAKERTSDVEASDEQFGKYPEALSDVRHELAFLKRMKGGRLNNLKFAVQHPRETLALYAWSPTHSRQNSFRIPGTPSRANSISSLQQAGTPDSRRPSKGARSRSNSALGAPTVMAGIVAAGFAANWSTQDGKRQRTDSEEEGDGVSRQQDSVGGTHDNQAPKAGKEE